MSWQISIPQIATMQKFARLREQLLHERMVSNTLMSRCHAIFANRRNIHPELTVWGLQHSFLVNFGTPLRLTVVGPAAAHETGLQPFTERIPKIPGTCPRQLSCPFTGSGVACLERSVLPAHAGRRVVLLRILEILEPVACTIQGYAGRLSWPKAHELLMVSFRDGPPRPWAYDVDRKTRTGAALRGLVEIWRVCGHFRWACAHRIADVTTSMYVRTWTSLRRKELNHSYDGDSQLRLQFLT
ncbi:hypothetical protein C8J57DRAFT_1311687 [Mycena rebaudengoi]|nr:hypothetical protein C8J57DRAFT_1311687 [Mycena rebaudengoi]